MPLSEQERADNVRRNILRIHGQDIERDDETSAAHFDLLGRAHETAMREQKRREQHEGNWRENMVKGAFGIAATLAGGFITWLAAHFKWNG